VARRIWIDVTGLRPGSDAGIFGLHLAQALARAGEKVRPCHRVPGLVTLGLDGLADLMAVPPIELTENAPTRPAPFRTPPFQSEDGELPGEADIVLFLALSGDASRMAARGAAMVLVATSVTQLARPEWRGKSEVEEAAVWLRETAPHVGLCIVQSEESAGVLRRAGIASARIVRGAADGGAPSAAPAHPGPFIFASGEIGESGQTRQLLPVWRRLSETMADGSLPDLVIAGPVGPQANDVLDMLVASRFLDGRARVILYPSAAQIAAFARDCVFAVSMSPATGWGRGTLNAQCMGAPCLSAFLSHGAVPFDPENAAAVAARIRAWLVDPPVKPPLFARTWDDVARDLLRVLPT
jgi:hypothetical protein